MRNDEFKGSETVVDLIALFRYSFPGHHRTVRFLQLSRDELIVPVSVLPEAAYLLAVHLGAKAEQQLVQSIVNGEMEVEELTIPDLRRSLELMRRYEDAQIGFVDELL